MLAVNWMTAEALDITESEKDALVKTLYMLESGELEWTDRPNIPNGFNMTDIMIKSDCGTQGCILGWARTFDERAFPGSSGRNFPRKMNALFMPSNYRYENYTVAEAAHALRTYLVTGTPDWA